MTTTPNLAITEVAASQDQKEVTINDGLTQLDNATQLSQSVTLSSNIGTLSVGVFTHAATFVIPSLTATGTLHVPASNRVFYVDNTANSSHDIVVTNGVGTTIDVPALTLVQILNNGTNLVSPAAINLGAGVTS